MGDEVMILKLLSGHVFEEKQKTKYKPTLSIQILISIKKKRPFEKDYLETIKVQWFTAITW